MSDDVAPQNQIEQNQIEPDEIGQDEVDLPENESAEIEAAENEAAESPVPAAGSTDGAADDIVDDTADDDAVTGSGGRPSKVERLENEGDIAADYLEELLDIADLDGDIDMDVEGDRASVAIGGADLAQLVGRNGEVLDALQELTRLAVYRETGERSRLMLDIGGHRARQRQRLVDLAGESIEKVKTAGEPVSLEPMTSFERKVVHDAVAAAGLTSESEGAEPKRYVVILPA